MSYFWVDVVCIDSEPSVGLLDSWDTDEILELFGFEYATALYFWIFGSNSPRNWEK